MRDAYRVIILSHAAWRTFFGSRPDATGQVVSLDGVGYSIVGVMPSEFDFPDTNTQFWIPFVWPRQARLAVVGRLNDGATVEGAAAEVNRLLQTARSRRVTRAGAEPVAPDGSAARGLPPPPPPPPAPAEAGVGSGRGDATPPLPSVLGDGRGGVASPASAPVAVVRLQEQMTVSARPALLILTVAVGWVLLIACANVANLLSARTAGRGEEFAIRAALEAGPQVFVDFRQFAAAGDPSWPAPAFVVRTKGGAAIAPSILSLVHQLDAQASVDSLMPMDQIIGNSLVRQRLYAMLLGAFATLALVLAAVGVYSVMTYIVSLRTREIGVRMALGAGQLDIVTLVVGRSVALVGIGLVVGLLLATAMTRILTGVLLLNFGRGARFADLPQVVARRTEERFSSEAFAGSNSAARDAHRAGWLSANSDGADSSRSG